MLVLFIFIVAGEENVFWNSWDLMPRKSQVTPHSGEQSQMRWSREPAIRAHLSVFCSIFVNSISDVSVSHSPQNVKQRNSTMMWSPNWTGTEGCPISSSFFSSYLTCQKTAASKDPSQAQFLASTPDPNCSEPFVTSGLQAGHTPNKSSRLTHKANHRSDIKKSQERQGRSSETSDDWSLDHWSSEPYLPSVAWDKLLTACLPPFLPLKIYNDIIYLIGLKGYIKCM
jgi:hypothetical protein